MDDFQLFAFPIDHLPFVALVLLIAFTLHEFAHAWFADRFGDPTPRKMGRVTLHPISHLDPIGTLLILFAGFGWAKPVLVNRHNFSKPRTMSLIVSVAGPLSNLLIAFVGTFLYLLLFQNGLINNASTGVYSAVELFFNYLISINIVLFIFNLIPLPPLDGYRVLSELMPQDLRARVSQQEHWGVVIFLLLVFIPPLHAVTIEPLFDTGQYIYDAMYRVCNAVL